MSCAESAKQSLGTEGEKMPDIVLLGDRSEELRRALERLAGVHAYTAKNAPPSPADAAVILGKLGRLRTPQRCRLLVTPVYPAPPGVCAETILTYGPGGRNTMTLSSIGAEKYIVSVQRSFTDFRGKKVDCQEIPVVCAGRDGDGVLALASVLLLCGVPPRELGHCCDV